MPLDAAQELESQVSRLRAEVAEAREVAGRASATWDRFRAERDFHRMHHKRVAQEKGGLITEMRRLRAHYQQYEPTILELRRKYEAALKEKMLATLERDRLHARVRSTQTTTCHLVLPAVAQSQPSSHWHRMRHHVVRGFALLC
jgi:chromosome segregation ATPase